MNTDQRGITQKTKEILMIIFFPKRIVQQCKELIQSEHEQTAIKLLKKILRIRPQHFGANRMLGEISMRRLKCDVAIRYFDKIPINKRTQQIQSNLAICYKIIGRAECYRVIKRNQYKQMIRYLPNEEMLLEKAINEAMKKKQWEIVIQGLEKMISYNRENQKRLITLSMIYQIIGDHENSKRTLKYVIENYKNKLNDKVHEKIVVFDNGETRIEFYKRFIETKQVIVTFDSINMEWDDTPFSFKLLERQDVDIIAIRKRKKKTYQQDLTQFDFINTVGSIVSNYKDKISYGFSLGAYCALYYTSLLNFRIYAISPRLSIHPVYGRTKIIGTHEFKHEISFPYNEIIKPLIVYDPKNNLDNAYVTKEILKSFPNAIFIKTPYSGHGVAPHLLKTGQLKEFVLSVIKGEIPKYNRKNRVKSSVYYLNLSEKCLQHAKLSWALDLINCSLELDPSSKKAVKIKTKALMKLFKYVEILDFLQAKIANYPEVLTFRNILIDIYLQMKRISEAEKELKKAIRDFGDQPSLQRRQDSLGSRNSDNC